jgi:hypothetical protein
MAHAFFIAGDIEEGIQQARMYLKEFVGEKAHADITLLQYEAFPVEESRRLHDSVYRTPMVGTRKGIIIAVSRMFHEAQNALLKIFEEPPEGTVLILVVPSVGIIIPTLRSRMTALPQQNIKKEKNQTESVAEIFLQATSVERAKLVEKILVRSKSDKQEEKNGARAEALQIAEALLRAGYEVRKEKSTAELQAFLSDLDRFIPILHERSAPLKLIFEHILLTTPRGV